MHGKENDMSVCFILPHTHTPQHHYDVIYFFSRIYNVSEKKKQEKKKDFLWVF